MSTAIAQVLDESVARPTVEPPPVPGAPETCEIAIVGAGPYGLSLAAQLSARGVNFRIFGKPLETWREHMPKDMLLKSEGFASSLSHPSKEATLKAWCAARGLAFRDRGLPVSLDQFLRYADWFQKSYVPSVEETYVSSLEPSGDGFVLGLENGSRVVARHVVLAVGISSFADIPETLSELAPDAVSHSYDHRDGAWFEGKSVIVIGGGASAVDLAALLKDEGARVRIVARDKRIRYHNPPDARDDTFFAQLRRPASMIGPGWRSWACVHLPWLFRLLPQSFRLRAVKRHLGPAPGWFMRERVEGHIEMLTGHSLDAARMLGNRVLLRFVGRWNKAVTLECEHVIAATGYRPDVSRIAFLSEDLRSRIATVDGAPQLSASFETSVPGLYAIGPVAANSFGPLMRFMTGAEWVAPLVAKHLALKVSRTRMAG